MLTGTVGLLGVWWLVISLSGWSATTAETNLGAGLLRLQNLEGARGPVAALLPPPPPPGSSIIAKLDADVVFDGRSDDTRLNLGIDGGTALFAAQRLLQASVEPRLVLIEANLLTADRAGNMTTLDEASRGLYFRLATQIDVLRREYRPSTWAYSLLKSAKDARAGAGVAAPSLDTFTVSALVPDPASAGPVVQGAESRAAPADDPTVSRELSDRWLSIIDRLRAEEATVAFVMMPDGDGTRQASRALALWLATERQLPMIDLEQGIPDARLQYSDGTHLIEQSALAVSRVLNSAVSSIPGTSTP